jgi:hypothetical protein
VQLAQHVLDGRHYVVPAGDAGACPCGLTLSCREDECGVALNLISLRHVVVLVEVYFGKLDLVRVFTLEPVNYGP